MNYPPFEVFKYEFEPLCLFISQFTGTPLNKTTSKRQMHFLSNYLKMLPSNNLTVVIETEYTDRHYLEDFSEYFSRCHQEYPKTCARVHFFNHPKLDTQYFKGILNRSLFDISMEINSLQSSYVGNIVIRPIPDTFLGKICFKAVDSFQVDSNKFLITNTSVVNLFGIKLKIESAPYQEQDRVLSACATSALWALYQAHPHYLNQRPPSNSQISSELSFQITPQSSSFPHQGLKMESMAESLNKHSLQPKILRVNASHKEHKEDSAHPPFYSRSQMFEFFENIHNYLISGIPVILGVEVWKENSDEFKKLGFHAITLMGLEYNDSKVQETGFKQESHKLKSLYAHDDRNGPFAKLIPQIGPNDENFFNGFSIKVDKHPDYPLYSDPNEEVYYPNAILIGSYHKVRINYSSILETCKTLSSQLRNSIDQAEIYPDEKESYKALLKDFFWKFKVIKGSEFKEGLFESKIRNQSINDLLIKSLPKYLWIVQVSYENEVLFTLLFDATDIPQGKVFIGYVEHIEGFDELFEMFSKYCIDHFHQYQPQHQIEGVSDHYWGILEYFKSKASFAEYLDQTYGVIKTPRYIKKGEQENGDVRTRKDAVCLSDNLKGFQLDIDHKYIWLIDKYGRLMIGVENELRLGVDGHPTLVQGEPARIAGELNMNQEKNRWEINSKSGRYSGDEYSEEDTLIYLKNVLSLQLKRAAITKLDFYISI